MYLSVRGRKQQEAGETCIVWNFVICFPKMYYSDDNVMENEMERAFGNYVFRILWGNLKERVTWKT
jgi:hypothetical protein